MTTTNMNQEMMTAIDDHDIESNYWGYNFEKWSDPDCEEPDESDGDDVSRFWYLDENTREYCFEGQHLHAFYGADEDENGKVDVGFFAQGDHGVKGYTDHIMLPKKVADALIEDIERNPDEYYLQSYLDYQGNSVYSLCRKLEKMPFDKNGVHATGSEYLETNGDWVTEYEDDIPEDYTPKYVYF